MRIFKPLITSILQISLYFFTCLLFAQALPPIQNFNTEDYNADNQNWMISEAANHKIYVANNDGLLEYNGEKWNLYPSPNNSIFRSIKVINDKIFTGCYMDFGYWETNEKGILNYTSLIPKFKKLNSEDEIFWNILTYNDWVVFQSHSGIYLYNIKNEEIQRFETDKTISKIFNIHNGIVFYVDGEGIFEFVDGSPQPITNNSIFKDIHVINIFPFKDDSILILTRNKGFFVLNKGKLTKREIAADSKLNQVTLYCSIQLQNGNFILGSIADGIIYIDADGNEIYQINQKNGLGNNTVLSLFEDSKNNIWIGLDNGIDVMNLNSPIKIYIDKNGALGTVYTSIVFNDYLYLGTNQGLFYKKITDNDDFILIDGTSGQVWSLYNFNNEDLLCGHHFGTFLIKNDKAIQIDKTYGSWKFEKLPISETKLLRGNYNGLYVLQKNNGQWKQAYKLDGFDISSRFFELDNQHNIWVSHEYKGVYKVHTNEDYSKITEISKDSTFALTESSGLVSYKNNILFANKEGIYKLNPNTLSFDIDPQLNTILDNENYLSGKLMVDDVDNLWSFSKDKVSYTTFDDMTQKIKTHNLYIPLSLRRIISGFENISHQGNSKYLLGTVNGYLSIDTNQYKENNQTPKIALNSITYTNKKQEKSFLNLKENGIFKYRHGIVTFEYSVPGFDSYNNVQYHYKLSGRDNQWSEWSNKSSITFENLAFGNYDLNVEAKVGNKISENTIHYTFEVKKPWYVSNIAIVIYILLLLLILYVIQMINLKYYNRKLKHEQEESEKKIIKIKNEKLNQDIENKNKELALSKMSIIKKNDLLNSIKKELQREKGKKDVMNLIEENLNNTKDWDFFIEAFNNYDKEFLNRLKTIHPNLNHNDIRLCVYLRMNLSSKEIARLLNISVKSVETKRYRLRKRMNLPHKESLVNYIFSL